MHLPGSRYTTVVLAGVHMLQVAADTPDGIARMLFFNVRVKRVVQDPDVRMTDGVTKRQQHPPQCSGNMLRTGSAARLPGSHCDLQAFTEGLQSFHGALPFDSRSAASMQQSHRREVTVRRRHVRQARLPLGCRLL